MTYIVKHERYNVWVGGGDAPNPWTTENRDLAFVFLTKEDASDCIERLGIPEFWEAVEVTP